jgi:hypothetical protein
MFEVTMRAVAISGAIFVFAVAFLIVDFFAMRVAEGQSRWIVAGATAMSALVALTAALSSYRSTIKRR